MNPFTVIGSWMADDSMLLAAQSGVSLGSDIYSQIDPRMSGAPKNLMVAYEQAIYFVAIAVRRAMRERRSTDFLMANLNRLVAEAAAVQGEMNFLCTMTGFACPSGGSVAVLNDARDIVEASPDLPSDDEVQIASFLKSNIFGLQLRQAAPVAVAVLSGLAAGAWWYHSHRSR